MANKKIKKQETHRFTFVIIEKNGSGTYAETCIPNSKKELEEFDKDLTEKMNGIFGVRGWKLAEILHDDEVNIQIEVKKWFDELDLEIDDKF